MPLTDWLPQKSAQKAHKSEKTRPKARYIRRKGCYLWPPFRKTGKTASWFRTSLQPASAEMPPVSRFAITAHGRRPMNTLRQEPGNTHSWKQPNGSKPSVSTAQTAHKCLEAQPLAAQKRPTSAHLSLTHGSPFRYSTAVRSPKPRTFTKPFRLHPLHDEYRTVSVHSNLFRRGQRKKHVC